MAGGGPPPPHRPGPAGRSAGPPTPGVPHPPTPAPPSPPPTLFPASARVGRALQPPEVRIGADGERRRFFGGDRGPAEMTARDALSLATRGGAEVLGRSDIGHLAPGMCADLALFDLRTLGFAGGAVHDPVGALLLCASPQAAWTVVNGRVVVREGRLATLELEPLVERHNRLARKLAGLQPACNTPQVRLGCPGESLRRPNPRGAAARAVGVPVTPA